jgi:putative pyrroloquinoline-quinone binding quinoprotein
MREDFVTRLQLQLRDAAEREARAGALGHALHRARRQLSLPVVAGGLAVVLAAIAVAAGVMLLRDEPEPSGPRVVAKLQLTGNPEDIVPAFGSLWISDPVAGEVVRVDPQTRSVLARIPVGSGQYIATEPVGDELWVRSERDTRLQRIDPATNEVRARLELRTPDGRAFPSLFVLASGAGVWAVGDEGALRLDPRTGAGLQVVAAPTGDSAARGFGIGDDVLWSLGTDGRIRRFDAATGEPQGAFVPGLAATQGIVGFGPDVMAGMDSTIARLDGSTGRVLWQRAFGDRIFASAAADGIIWMHVGTARQGDRLIAVAGDSGKVVSSTPLDAFGSNGMAVDGREIWVNTTGGDTLVLRR